MENIYFFFEDKRILFEVTPRCGVHTVHNYARQLSQDSNIDRFSDFVAISNLKVNKYYLKIKFARNPYYRAISSYVWVYRNYVELNYEAGSLNYISRKELTFDKYLSLLRFYDLKNCNHHFHLQYKQTDYTQLIKAEESIDSLNHVLSKHCSQKIVLEKVIANQRKKINKPNLHVSQLTQDQIENEYGTVNYDSYLNEKNKAIIAKLYNADFVNCHYSI